MTRTFPKNAFVAEVQRTSWAPENYEHKVKNGGVFAILQIPADLNEDAWGDVMVHEPDNEEEFPGWFEYVEKGMELRVVIQRPAKRANELYAHSLRLRNQPTLTQRIIKAKLGVKQAAEEKPLEAVQAPNGDKLEEQLKLEVEKKQHLETLKHYLPRLRYLIKKGEWLDNNDTGLLLAQSTICKALYEWSEDYSPDADSTFAQNVMDACKYLIDAMVPLRGPLFDSEEPEGTLSVTCRHGSSKTVLDLKHLQ